MQGGIMSLSIVSKEQFINDRLVNSLVVKSRSIKVKTRFSQPRSEPRVHLATTLFLRRTINSESYRHRVITYDLSRHGASIISDLPLEIGGQIEVYGFNDRFSATAIIRHREYRNDGKWNIGLQFINSTGDWLIN